jgi:hypothetical protein
MAWTEIRTEDELVAVVGEPTARAANKVRPVLHELDRAWLAASPFCLLATSAHDGSCDVSPKGDPAGRLAYVLSDTTVALAERPGNRRVDGYRNVLTNPHVCLLFMLPGRDDTLRINGRARLVSDAPFFDQMVVKNHRPLLALVVEIDEVFHHCAKALMRSELWHPDTWRPDALPTRPPDSQGPRRSRREPGGTHRLLRRGLRSPALRLTTARPSRVAPTHV